MKTGYKPNTKIPARYIIEIGLCRKRNMCVLCGNRMDVPNHNIQLCRKCRLNELEKFANCEGGEK